jgi:hypothetical protein
LLLGARFVTSAVRRLAWLPFSARNRVQDRGLDLTRSLADACLAAFAVESCAEVEAGVVPAPCSAAFTGQAANGQNCLDDVECANGWCTYGTACPGTCTAFTAINAPCQANAECGPGNACAWNGAAGVCEAATYAGAGHPCSSAPCAPGYYCDVTQQTPTCSAQAGQGQSCVPLPGSCAAGLGCGTDAYCHPLAGEQQSCAVAQCSFDLFCSSAAKCVVPVAGQECGGVIDYHCLDGTRASASGPAPRWAAISRCASWVRSRSGPAATTGIRPSTARPGPRARTSGASRTCSRAGRGAWSTSGAVTDDGTSAVPVLAR